MEADYCWAEGVRRSLGHLSPQPICNSSADAKCIEKVLPAAGWRAANASMMQDLVLLPCIAALFALHCVNWLLPPAGSNVNTPRNAITPASWSA